MKAIEIAYIVGIFLSVSLALLFLSKVKKIRSFAYLFPLALLLAFRIFQELLALTELYLTSSFLMALSFLYFPFFILPPLLFLYVKDYLRQEKPGQPSFPQSKGWHFVPALLALAFVDIPLFLSDFEHQQVRMNRWLFTPGRQEQLLSGIMSIIFIFYALSMLAQFHKTTQFLKSQYANGRVWRFRWIFVVLISSLLFASLDMTFLVLDILYGIPLFFLRALEHLLLCIILYGVLFYIFLKPHVLVIDKQDTGRRTRMTLQKEREEEYLRHLREAMESRKLFRDPELTLETLSETLRIPKYAVTQLLNQKIKKNFYTYVNDYRIEEVKRRLADGQYGSQSILALALECGFSSKTSFNQHFKKTTGMTPSAFRKRYGSAS